jgi:outer membrane protein assembly factor BamB
LTNCDKKHINLLWNITNEKTRNMKKSILSAVLLILFVCGATGQDWIQFRGTNRDCRVTGFKAPSSWPSELNQVWKVQVGTGDATPVLEGKKIYLNTRQGENEVILCLDAATGKELWKNEYPSPAVTGPAGSHPGPRSTPVITSGKIVTFGAAGILSCLDAATGKVLWRKNNPDKAVPQFYTGISPIVENNVVYVHLGTRDKGQVVAIDLKSGAEKWKWEGDGPSYASPSVMSIDGKKTLVLFSEKNLLAFDMADGKLLWQLAAPDQQRFYNCVSPVINGKTIYFTGQGTGMKAVEASLSGTKELWNNKEVGAKWNTPVLKDGFLYGFTDQKRIYCLNAANGSTAWLTIM